MKPRSSTFVGELCELIKMRRFGETQVVRFGDDPRVTGYSMTQLIETSLISAHFADNSCAIYLDVFSCAPYNPREAAEFAAHFFHANSLEGTSRQAVLTQPARAAGFAGSGHDYYGYLTCFRGLLNASSTGS